MTHPKKHAANDLKVHPAAQYGWERLKADIRSRLALLAKTREGAKPTDDPNVYSVGVNGVRVLVENHEGNTEILAVATPREIQALHLA